MTTNTIHCRMIGSRAWCITIPKLRSYSCKIYMDFVDELESYRLANFYLNRWLWSRIIWKICTKWRFFSIFHPKLSIAKMIQYPHYMTFVEEFENYHLANFCTNRRFPSQARWFRSKNVFCMEAFSSNGSAVNKKIA